MFTELLDLLKRVGCKITLHLCAQNPRVDGPPAIFLETGLEHDATQLETGLEHDATSYYAMEPCCVDSHSCRRGRLEVLINETEESGQESLEE
jgi:hypothetical protein